MLGVLLTLMLMVVLAAGALGGAVLAAVWEESSWRC